MYRLLFNPKNLLKGLDKYPKTMLLLCVLITSIFWFFAAKITGTSWGDSALALLTIIASLLLGAFSLNIILYFFNKNNYFYGLTALTIPWLIFGFGLFVNSILIQIPYIGLFLGTLVVFVMIPYGIAMQLKIMMDLFKLDMLTAFIILLILFVAGGAAILSVVGALGLQTVSNLGFGLLPIGFP
jgi:hypothetical protein